MELEDQYRFDVQAITPYGGVADISLRCTRCGKWATHIDRPISLRDLNERAQEHAEVCR
jgi:hypothetical protein